MTCLSVTLVEVAVLGVYPVGEELAPFGCLRVHRGGVMAMKEVSNDSRYYYLTHELAVFSVLNSGYCVHHASPLKIHSIVKTILWKRSWKVILL